MTTIIDGTAGITFPSGSGTQAAQSKVLQVVNATSVAVSTTSTTYVSTGLTTSITPLFSTSKILVLFSAGICSVASVTGEAISFQIWRGGSSVVALVNHLYNGSASSPRSSASFTYLDSPSTTSSTSYTIYFSSRLGNTVYMADSSTATLQLLEIAA